MTKSSGQLKASIVAKMLPPTNASLAVPAKEAGIPKDALYRRIKARGSIGGAMPEDAPSAGPSSEENVTVVPETAGMNDAELSEYCRRKGLYPQQIEAWRATCEQANASAPAKADQDRLRKQFREINQLEAELRHKKTALAEDAALFKTLKYHFASSSCLESPYRAFRISPSIAYRRPEGGSPSSSTGTTTSIATVP